MDVYTVLLVDDEEDVIQVIIKKIQWEKLGFSVIGYAGNGLKAMEMVEEFQPDVVLTDIKMPYMDGLELSKHIKTQFPATKILLFTGFDEFEYAKEAVHLEIEEYVLKPLNSVELTEVLSRLKEKLDQEISEKRNVEILQKYYMESLPLLQADFYASLIEGRIRDKEINKYMKDYQISMQGPLFCCIVIHTSSSQIPDGMNPMLLATSVHTLAKERLEAAWQAKLITYLGNTVLIAQMKSENDVSVLTDECDRFCRYAYRIIGAVVTAGIGRICTDITALSASYNSAREAASYRVLYGASRAINIREIAPRKMTAEPLSGGAELTNLFKIIKLGAENEVEDAVKSYMNQLTFSGKSMGYHQIALMELVEALYRFSIHNDIFDETLAGDIGNLYSALLDFEPQELSQWLTDMCLSLQKKLITVRSQSTKSFVLSAQEYIHEHYFDESLSLDDVCRVLGVSNAYFSTVFKKETGKSFIGYLTDYRMEKAARLLIETNEKSYIIAQNVGYADPNYFSYVFKRCFGTAPSKYRSEHGESER